jgi:hypothetical protein
MPDSGPDLDALAAKHETNREARFDAVERWVAYIREQPPEVWGPQQNDLIEAQLQSARETDLSVEHQRFVRSFAQDANPDKAEPDSSAHD